MTVAKRELFPLHSSMSRGGPGKRCASGLLNCGWGVANQTKLVTTPRANWARNALDHHEGRAAR